jgi:hypothetical protein
MLMLTSLVPPSFELIRTLALMFMDIVHASKGAERMSAISSKVFRILGFASTWKRPWSVETIKEAANAAFLNFNAMQGHYQWFMSSGVRGAFAPASGISSASASQRHHSRCQASFPLRNTSADTYTIWGRRLLINAVKNTEKTQQIQPNKKSLSFPRGDFHHLSNNDICSAFGGSASFGFSSGRTTSK